MRVEMAKTSELTLLLLKEDTDGSFMMGYIRSHRKVSGTDITPREVLVRCGYNEEQIAEYLHRNGLKE